MPLHTLPFLPPGFWLLIMGAFLIKIVADLMRLVASVSVAQTKLIENRLFSTAFLEGIEKMRKVSLFTLLTCYDY